MPAVEVWLLGGPADGRITHIEVDDDGTLPQAIVLPQSGAYLGARDHPSQPVQHRYLRCAGEVDPPTFQYDGPLPQDQ
ncbi:hypothetical protein ADK66_22290 [Micromonospora sp. NRRL B-16802]|uniref:hypothetical protein n=1 Tax=Micromonospora sp. NRRL B-16802 TaxID=1415541 RepID=UPI0006AF2993|nr:hypothetical protein [Micromonospora sp. NRRL B-16802]KOX06659.1 hypothetical protein ADK66_22290 [Micromonospora sp. NRRL B-16802]